MRNKTNSHPQRKISLHFFGKEREKFALVQTLLLVPGVLEPELDPVLYQHPHPVLLHVVVDGALLGSEVVLVLHGGPQNVSNISCQETVLSVARYQY